MGYRIGSPGWVEEAIKADAARTIRKEEVQIAGAFPVAFTIVGFAAQIAIGVAVAMYGAEGADIPRLALAQVVVLISFVLALGCARHHHALSERLKQQIRDAAEHAILNSEEDEVGEWPPRPRISRNTESL